MYDWGPSCIGSSWNSVPDRNTLFPSCETRTTDVPLPSLFVMREGVRPPPRKPRPRPLARRPRQMVCLVDVSLRKTAKS